MLIILIRGSSEFSIWANILDKEYGFAFSNLLNKICGIYIYIYIYIERERERERERIQS